MPIYDFSLFDPPALLAKVILRNPESNKELPDVPLLIDTGADITFIPYNSANELGLNTLHDKSYEVMGFDGSISIASAVQLELLFLNKAFRVLFLLIDQEWGILGRDILNHLTLLFDGPRLEWNKHQAESQEI